MNLISRTLGLGVVALPALALTTDASAAVVLSYTFDDAPVISVAQASPINRTSAPTTTVGVTASNFSVYVADANNKGVVIAEAADSSFTAAQLSNVNNPAFNFTDGPYAQFSVYGVESLTSLSITARGGIEWNTSGVLGSSQNDRHSDMVLRTSLDNYASNVGAVFQPGTGTHFATWDTEVIDLTGLDLGAATNVTFRLYVERGGTSTSSGFHRTQIDAVSLDATPVPEPATLALVGLCALATLRRRGR